MLIAAAQKMEYRKKLHASLGLSYHILSLPFMACNDHER
jgi:hypothetical protein